MLIILTENAIRRTYTPGTITVNVTSGLANLAVSTCEATLTSALSPVDNPSGSGSQTLTFAVNVVAGTCTAGGLISFNGENHEQAIISSVTAPSGVLPVCRRH